MSSPNASIHTQRHERLHKRYGPWAIVTGASSGIGREMAVRLAEGGLNLVLVARSHELLEHLAADLTARYNVEAHVIIADLATDTGVQAVVNATRTVDVGLLVAAAGFGTSGAFLDAALDHELDMLSVNCRAVLTLCHTFGQRFAQRGHGGMILMSSIVSFQGTPYAAHYAATKAYVQALAEALHVEWAPLGIDVLASAPGPTNSGFATRANMRMGTALEPVDVVQPTLAELGKKSTIVPGQLSKLLTAALAPLPRWARVRIMGRVMWGMTHHQRTPRMP